MAMRRRFAVLACVLFCVSSLISQSLKGIVLDEKTKLPIESASVYFDGTTIGTSTNDKGEFKIELVRGVTAPLIVSYLGYQKSIISTYSPDNFYRILLIEDLSLLDEVVISADDGMSKALKMKHFRKEFLGKYDNGMSCTILNESDLVLRYNSKNKQLTASSRKPIVVRNQNLKYLITFDLQDFYIDYSYVDLLKEHFSVKMVSYFGTSFYKNLDTLDTRRTRRKRDKAYEGSSLHFMRALSNKRLDDDGYVVFERGFKIPTYKYITVQPIENSTEVKVTIDKRLVVLYDNDRQSAIQASEEGFIIDIYGNYAPIENVLFGGDLGDQRLGDSLPFDYQLMDE